MQPLDLHDLGPLIPFETKLGSILLNSHLLQFKTVMDFTVEQRMFM